ncbi:MAG: hypothetical protein U0821_27400 [Chloroflexota bacterium]
MKILRVVVLAAVAAMLVLQPLRGLVTGAPEAHALGIADGLSSRAVGAKDQNHNHNGNNNRNENDENDNEDEDEPPPPPQVRAPAPPPPPPKPVCSRPGDTTVLSSDDERIAVRVFNSMPRSVKFRFIRPVDPSSVPATPGRKVDDLLFQLVAEECDGGGIGTLPAEVNLGVRYTDGEVSGMDESKITISRLGADNKWQAEPKQAPDPGANYVSATITNLGYFVVHER